MRWLLFAILCVGGMVAGTPASAQDGKPPAKQPASKWAQRNVQPMVFDGQLEVAVSSGTLGQISENADSRHEQFRISIEDGNASVRYELSTPGEQLTVDIVNTQRAFIRRQLKASDAPESDETPNLADREKLYVVEYEQLARRPAQLSVAKDGQTRRVEGATLWHLLILEPDLCGRHLLPVLETLRPDWPLTATADEAKRALLRAAESNPGNDHRLWAALVSQLTDDRFAARERAERKLRKAGEAPLAYLRTLPRSQLDAEQRRRIAEILAEYDDEDGEDTAERVASQLLGDRELWIGLLEDDAESTRRIAAEQLKALVGRPIEFDPAAEASIRNAQAAALRKQLGAR